VCFRESPGKSEHVDHPRETLLELELELGATAAWLRIGRATHRDTYLCGQLANSFVAKLPQADLRFDQALLSYDGNVFRTGRRIR
jgi:hypothetical protein